MAKAKKQTKKVKQIKKIALPKELPAMDTIEPSCSLCCCRNLSKTAKIAIALAIVILGLLAINRGLLFVALVNGKPIFRSSLNSILLSRYGKVTVENMITERLIENEAKKAGIVITQKDITVEEENIMKSFGGNVTLEEMLTYQGMTKKDFDEQVRVQMLLTKLVGKDIQVTDEEIATYITSNRATLVATDDAGISQEAKEAILTQKIGEQIQPWFTEIRNKAKVFKFIN